MPNKKASSPASDSKLSPDINEKFVDACENGDYPTVTRILDEVKDFHINVTDNLGRTALRLAVENEHLEVSETPLIPPTRHVQLLGKFFLSVRPFFGFV